MAYLVGVGRQLVAAAKSAPFLDRDEEQGFGGALEDAARRTCVASADPRPYAARHRAGRPLPPLRPADRRSHPGRPCRPARGRGAIRSGSRGALFDLCDLVDPRRHSGLHSAQLVDRARRHEFGAKGAVLQSAPAARQTCRMPAAAPPWSSTGSPRRSACRAAMSNSWIRACPVRISRSMRRYPTAIRPCPRSGSTFLPTTGRCPTRSSRARSIPTAAPAGSPMRSARLSKRELDILRERRLVENAATLESLGDRLGISKERVRQIENRALEKLRRALIDQHPQERRDHAA